MPLSDTVQFSSSLKGVILSRQSGNGQHVVDGNPAAKPVEEEAPAQDPKESPEQIAEEAYQRGLAEGKALQEAAMKARISTLENQLGEILNSVIEERSAMSRNLENLLPELVIEGVGRMLYGFQPEKETVRMIVEEILEGVDAEDEQVRLMLNPMDLENLMELENKFAESHPGLRFVADETLHRGECRLDSRFGLADARHSAKLANLRKVLE